MAGYIDTWGRGTIKIIGSCLESGLPEPLIIEKNGGIEVTILNNNLKGGPMSGPIGGPIGGPITTL
jgi:ATP-dependent DNA helicase RecG